VFCSLRMGNSLDFDRTFFGVLVLDYQFQPVLTIHF
jgi:hypothetical protein